MASYKYQRDSRYFVQIAEGIKEAGAEELAELGAKDIPHSKYASLRLKDAVADYFKEKTDQGRLDGRLVKYKMY